MYIEYSEYEAQHQVGDATGATDELADAPEEEILVAEAEKIEKYEMIRKNAEVY